MSTEELKKRLEIEDITKTFVSVKGEKFGAIRDVPLDARDSELLVLLGPGLCGKTVLLNILASSGKATSGTIRLGGQGLKGCNDKISMVFQKLGLFSWKTVMENVEVGLEYTGMSKKERREQTQKFIDLVGLTGFGGTYLGQLPNGTKQRVKVTRAYTVNLEILILDGPSGQLDAQTRYFVEGEVLRTWEQEEKTAVFVINSIGEAVCPGDRIIPLEKCFTSVGGIYDTDLPKPQDMMDEALLELRTRISDNMELSVQRDRSGHRDGK